MTDLQRFEAECRRDIPLLTAMELSLVDYHELALTMEAPLAPNINNKGTAFGGSIASIGLFGGWAVATLAFMDNGIDNTEIVVFRNEMTFERPARGHLVVKVTIDPAEFGACLAKLRGGSDERLRFNVNVEILHDDVRCATMTGLYVVWLK
jgi:thioesterase domain-containing protein